MSKLTPMERFIAGIPADRRRAYDARLSDKGLKRVTVMVPTEHAEWVKYFARFIRNSEPWVVEHYRTSLEEYLADSFRDFDEAVASGEVTDD